MYTVTKFHVHGHLGELHPCIHLLITTTTHPVLVTTTIRILLLVQVVGRGRIHLGSSSDKCRNCLKTLTLSLFRVSASIVKG